MKKCYAEITTTEELTIIGYCSECGEELEINEVYNDEKSSEIQIHITPHACEKEET